MKWFSKFIALGVACLVLAGCASLGYGLDDAVDVGITGESGYALLKYPSAWSFQGLENTTPTEGAEGATGTDASQTAVQPVTTPVAGTYYRSVAVSPSDTSETAPEVQVLAGCNENSFGIHPNSSDSKIYEVFDGLMTMTFGENANVTNKQIVREGDTMTVIYDYDYAYSDTEVSVMMKYIFNGDYVYFAQGTTTGNAEEMDVATMKAMVNEFGLSALA